MPESRVIIVVDRNYGAQLRLLRDEVPAWVVDSPQNHPLIVELWNSRKRWTQSAILTSFSDEPESPPEQLLSSVLGVIDLHHGYYSQGPAWNVAQIVGAEATSSVIAAMRSLGFALHQKDRDGAEFHRTNDSISLEQR